MNACRSVELIFLKFFFWSQIGPILGPRFTGMLMMKLKDMRMGTFKGMTALNKKDGGF